MKEIKAQELKELQMQILDYVDAFCARVGIRYTISGGTLLGAVRHGGFIPWDDDVDIQMVRAEYLRFCELWKAQEGGHPYEFISIESGKNMGYPFGKICIPGTIALVGGVERTGVYIDVFPVDKVLDEKDFHSRHDRILRLYKFQMLHFAWQKSRHTHVPFPRRLVLMAGRFISREKIAVKINELAQKRQGQPCPFYFEMVAGTICKNPIPASVFENYVRIPFEDRKYQAVAEYDTYLTATFGNYMQLPPVEKRVGHRENVYYWK